MECLRDFLIAGTPLRGLILQGDLCVCAYLGVQIDHWAADLDEMEFRCHRDVTFNGPGDGVLRPAGWHWYGWDYGHFGDKLQLSPRLRQALTPDEQERLANLQFDGRQWTVDEVEHEVIDAALDLMNKLQQAELGAGQVSSGKLGSV